LIVKSISLNATPVEGIDKINHCVLAMKVTMTMELTIYANNVKLHA